VRSGAEKFGSRKGDVLDPVIAKVACGQPYRYVMGSGDSFAR